MFVTFAIIVVAAILIMASKILNWDDIITLFLVVVLMTLASITTMVNKDLHQKINELEQGCLQYEQVEEIMWRRVK